MTNNTNNNTATTTNVRPRKYHGLLKALQQLPTRSRNDGYYIQLHYDIKEDRVYYNFHVSYGHNSYTRYDDPHIINIGALDERITLRAAKVLIDDMVSAHERDALHCVEVAQ